MSKQLPTSYKWRGYIGVNNNAVVKHARHLCMHAARINITVRRCDEVRRDGLEA